MNESKPAAADRNVPRACIELGPAPLGIYISVPFCRTKCSYCNFASGVFSPRLLHEYSEALAQEMALASAADGTASSWVDTVYWGGGTPSLIPPDDFGRIAAALQRHFRLLESCEYTVEMAPGTIGDPSRFARAGVNRASLGVQSFADREARAVGRIHTRAVVLADIAALRAAGIQNLNLDLIAGLPHQTEASWRESLRIAIETGVPHLSIYMFEEDEDSRLGSELIAGGARYHAADMPDGDAIADFYEIACDSLNRQGITQYEISNFARPGFESRHNRRYWLRQPYAGFGVDAHSFLSRPARRLANLDDLTLYSSALREGRLARISSSLLTPREEQEEEFFLGLRMNAGVFWDPDRAAAIPGLEACMESFLDAGLVEKSVTNGANRLLLTPRGRLLSNEVFASILP